MFEPLRGALPNRVGRGDARAARRRQMRAAVIEAKVGVQEIREALTRREVGQHEATIRR